MTKEAVLSTFTREIEVESIRRPRFCWTPELIEQEAENFIQSGNRLSDRSLTQSGNSRLANAIKRYYPGKFTSLKNKFGLDIRYRLWTIERIENEATEFYRQHGHLLTGRLEKSGEGKLVSAVRRLYPGGMVALKEKIGIKDSRKPKDYWKKPENTRRELQEYLQSVQTSSGKILHSIMVAGVNFYPGGIDQLRIDANFPRQKKKSKPKGYWTEEIIKKEAEEFYKREGTLSQASLAAKGRGDLIAAISQHYRGKFTQIKIDLSIDNISNWSIEKIEEEAANVYRSEGGISQSILGRLKNFSLSHAITRQYPGGFTALRERLEIIPPRISLSESRRELQKLLEYVPRKTKLNRRADRKHKPSSFWTAESIEHEARNFFEQYGKLDQRTLQEHDRSDLARAITKAYPGKMASLRIKLEIINGKHKPVGYWTEETIEEEARKFIEAYGSISQWYLRKYRYGYLDEAIRKKYLGGLQALREKLSETKSGENNNDPHLLEAVGVDTIG